MPFRYLAPIVGALLLLAGPTFAAPASPVPKDGDAYSTLVARAEADDQATDFAAMRHAWLDSAAKKRAPDTTPLEQQLRAAVAASNDRKVAEAARRIIAAKYIDIRAHKYLRQACEHLHDTACVEHEHFVEFGLLRSVVAGGDGKTAATAWSVVSVDEEYFIMEMLGVRVGSQSLVNQDGKVFDALHGDNGQVYYFEIGAFFGREFM